MDMTAFWWFFGALLVIFFFIFVFSLYDVGPAVKESYHPAPSPVIPHHHAEEAPASKAAAPAAEDDLRKIEGIGPKIEAALKQAGIRTFADLAAKTPEELQAVLDAAGFARISNPETWPEQAALAAKGDWEALAALQGTLKGGRRRA
ncbi:MAG TPA: hypothetical protein ENJ54_09490 [Chloroflexi bacterium]|nr:hypothetical protein [Chloroflexota bacterium]